MPNIILQIILVTSVALLIAALLPIKRIYAMLPPGSTRTIWVNLGVLIGLSAAGYLLFLRINYIEGPGHREDWLVALVFLAASIFVLVVCVLSHNTAKDVSKIASLQLAATVDPVTELYNRRHIMSLLEAECIRSIGTRSPLSILLIDVDSFKKVNDTLGHQTGDYVLKELAALIAAVESPSHFVGRYGGEEFLVLLPSTDSSTAGHIAERLRATVETASILSNGTLVASPTISIGIATAYGWQESPGDLVAIADGALYTAKAAGRNQVCHGFEKTRQRSPQLTVVSSNLQVPASIAPRSAQAK